MTLSPESFALSPLFSLLPSIGSVARLEGLVTALFARFESVESARESSHSTETELQLAHEAAMLRQILDWLAVQPLEEGSDE